MPLKVVVELQIHAVTCPGVFLPDKDDILLNVSMLGQCKETRCLPAVFPLLFHEKMRFEKVFQKQVDPAAVVEILEKHAAGFKLIQIGPSDTPCKRPDSNDLRCAKSIDSIRQKGQQTGAELLGMRSTKGEDVLATYKENHRDFLFPEPKLTPPYPGVDREVLMKTSHGFPGIAPKIEFSTRTTIKEKDFQNKNSSSKLSSRRSLPNSPCRKSSPTRNGSCTEKGYSSSTRSSKSRSPSPYTRRRMCELSKESQQRLAYLNLGSFEFKSDSNTKPPFIVRHVDQTKPIGEKNASQLQSPTLKRHSNGVNQIRRALTFDNLDCNISTEKDELSLEDLSMPRKAHLYADKGHALDDPLSSSIYSLNDLRTSPGLKLNCRERRRSESNTWESIHTRVRNLLSTHSARQLLTMDISNREADHILERSRRSLNNSLEDKTF